MNYNKNNITYKNQISIAVNLNFKRKKKKNYYYYIMYIKSEIPDNFSSFNYKYSKSQKEREIKRQYYNIIRFRCK